MNKTTLNFFIVHLCGLFFYDTLYQYIMAKSSEWNLKDSPCPLQPYCMFQGHNL
jgi:hypothetical protein